MSRNLLPTGAILGQYEVVRVLGEGGMGAVYEAVHRQLGRRVAIKTLLPDLMENEEARRRFRREARASAAIEHPHVVTVTDSGLASDLAYLVMEFLEGETLADRLGRVGKMTVYDALDLLLPVLDGLHAGHKLGVVHRDLKPSNVFLTTAFNGQVVPKLLDFGVSKMLQLNETVALTVSGATLGTPQYMAPEQIEGPGQVDARADQFAMALILWECIAGHSARQGGSPFEMMAQAATSPIPSLRSAVPDLDTRLDRVVVRALELKPPDRFADVPELMRALVPHARPDTRIAWAETFARRSLSQRK